MAFHKYLAAHYRYNIFRDDKPQSGPLRLVLVPAFFPFKGQKKFRQKFRADANACIGYCNLVHGMARMLPGQFFNR